MNSRTPETIDTSRKEVLELAEALSLFRSAMHRVAEQQIARPEQEFSRPRSRQTRGFLHIAVLGPALATAIFLASLPLYMHFRSAQQNAASSHTHQARRIADAELLRQIDAEVSEVTPDALEPMADFGSVSSATQSSSSAMENNHATQE